MKRRLRFLGMVLVLVGGVALGAVETVEAQDQPTPAFEDPCVQDPGICSEVALKAGESVLSGDIKVEGLGAGVIPALPPQPAALALQRVRLAPGASIVSPEGDPRVVLLVIERGTLTVRNSLAGTLTQAAATPAPKVIPAGTEFTMSAGDTFLSPAGSGGELRNDGTDEVSLLASLIVPLPAEAATPIAGTPMP